MLSDASSGCLLFASIVANQQQFRTSLYNLYEYITIYYEAESLQECTETDITFQLKVYKTTASTT